MLEDLELDQQQKNDSNEAVIADPTHVQRNQNARQNFYFLSRPIAHLIEDPEIQEIMINGEDDIWIEKKGRLIKQDIPIKNPFIRGLIKNLAVMDGRDVSVENGLSIVDTRLDRLRIAAAIQPTSVHGHIISIRKQSSITLTIDNYTELGNPAIIKNKEDFCEEDTVRNSEELVRFFNYIIKQHKNIIIAGGTSSGKTTFLKALLQLVDKNERVITLEDTPEIASHVEILPNNRVCLEANKTLGVEIRDLVKLSLRLRPDRIIVGEIRGYEAFDLMQALNTGHDGGITSLHANSAFEALSRLETMILMSDIQWPHIAIKQQIARTFDYVIFMKRDNNDGKRKVFQIIRILGIDDDGKYRIKNII